MIDQASELVTEDFAKIGLSVILGLFIGFEREMSDKMAGVRTFTLICIIGSGFAVVGRNDVLIGVGAILVLLFSILMGMKDISTDEDSGLSLTTSAALMVTYIVGALSGIGELYIAVLLSVVSSALLTSKEELHGFAGGVTEEELRSAIQFAVLAFVIFPILPDESFGPWNAIDAQLVWTLVIAVSGLGFVNYILVKKYEERGFFATGFFGGLVNSTAVIGTIADRVSSGEVPVNLAIGAVLLANAAMAIRNAVIAVTFVPETILSVGIPLLVISVIGVGLSFFVSDWETSMESTDLNSPFSLRNALVFGSLFIFVLIISAGTTQVFGETGFYASMFFAGLVSSGSSTTTAVTLASTGQITQTTASVGILIGTLGSILAKVALVVSIDRQLAQKTLLWSTVLLLGGTGATALVNFII